jgi:TolB-like protein/Flp pilus assembly protein TadD
VIQSSRGVFLSYASEDAGVAQRICDALRVAGIEVWFDQSELRGGDAWDQKIRQKIRDCALFVPIISAHTQARPEGYFRLEWKLAVDRSHLMAAEKAFLVPVVVDATTEPEALVPAQFREVQWTRIQSGEVAAAFLERIAALLNQPVAHHVGSPERKANRTPARRWPMALVAIATAAVVGLVIATAMRGRWLGHKPVPQVAASTTSASVAPMPADVPEKSIAVLPFADMSEKHDQEYFGDGMAEEILNLLAKLPGLHVPARTSSFYFKGKSEDIPTIARRLMVANVLEGSVRKSGNHVRVTVQLVRADNGYHLWSETYDRTPNDLFKVQDEIAGEIVRALKISMGNNAAARAVPTNSAEAHRLLLQAQFWLYRGTDDAQSRAASYYQQAIHKDPDYAEAWAGLAKALLWGGRYPGQSRQQFHELVTHTAERAVALGPKLAETHVALGEVRYQLDWDWDAATTEFETARSLDPDNIYAMDGAGNLAAANGRLTDALRLWEKSAQRDPLAAGTYISLAFAYYSMGRFAEAVAAMRKTVDLTPPAAGIHAILAQMLLGAGHSDEAFVEVQRESHPGYRASALARTYIVLGRRGDADRALAEVEKKYAAEMPASIATLYALRGDRDQAFSWLNRAYQQRDLSLIGYPPVTVDPDLRNLHGDRRWEAFLRKMKLVD